LIEVAWLISLIIKWPLWFSSVSFVPTDRVRRDAAPLLPGTGEDI
jgi:hypothetical protein